MNSAVSKGKQTPKVVCQSVLCDEIGQCSISTVDRLDPRSSFDILLVSPWRFLRLLSLNVIFPSGEEYL